MTDISTDELKTLCLSALKKAGVSQSDAEITADHYLENEFSGKSSHGIVRVIQTIKLLEKCGAPKTAATLETESPSISIYNANGALGPVAGMVATNAAIKKTAENGISFTGIRDYSSSAGSMAYYLRRIADAGLVAIMGCNSDALVAPPNGRERMIGTNPIGVCIPGKGTNFIGDLSTAAYPYGKIMVHKEKNEPVPHGVMIDAAGQPSTDPKDAYDGAILPMNGYKGFTLGLMIELIAGPLIGAKAIKKEMFDNDGLFIIAMNPKSFGNAEFYNQIETALQTIKSSAAPLEGDGIILPGERSGKALAKTLKSGQIDIADKTLEKLKELAA